MNKLVALACKIPFLAYCREKILYYRDYNKNNENRLSCGTKNPDKVFYVIRNYTYEAGWGSILIYVTRHIKYALEKGFIPIVDMQNYPNMYQENKENSWETYFKQLSDYSLEEVYSSKNVILCSSEFAKKGYICFEDKDWDEYCSIFNKYIHLKEDIQLAIDEERKHLEIENKCVLGVLVRGTDYVSLAPSLHSVPLSAEETITKINSIKERYDKIYLATEDDDIFNSFKEFYSNDVLCYTNQKRFLSEEVTDYLANVIDKQKVSVREFSISYLKVLYILASCNSLMGSGCGGLYTAGLINNNKYDEKVVMSNGTYK